MLIKYSVNIDDIVAFNRFHINHSPTHRRMKIINIFITPIILFAAFSLLSRNLPGTVSAAVFSILLALVMWKWLPKRVERQIKRMYCEGKNKDLLGERQLEIDEKNIFGRSKHSESKFSWEAVERLAFTADYTFIYVSSVNAIVLSNNSIVEGDIEHFKGYLKEVFHKTRKDENNSSQTPDIIELPQEIKCVDTRIGKNSEFGMLSFILSLIQFMALLTLLFMLFMDSSESQASEDREASLGAFIFIASMFANFTGIAFGIAGIFQKNRKKVFAIIGLILNSMILFSFLILILIGILLG